MSAIGRRGEFQGAGHAKSHPDRPRCRSGCRAREKARLFVLVADDERTIARIKELASTCIEIESLAGEHDPVGSPFVAAPMDATWRNHLTQRKLEIALGVARGLSNKDIGRELGISHFTVRNHLSQILLILGLSSRQELGEFLRTLLLRRAQRLHGLCHIAGPDIAPRHEDVGKHDPDAILEEVLDILRPSAR